MLEKIKQFINGLFNNYSGKRCFVAGIILGALIVAVLK